VAEEAGCLGDGSSLNDMSGLKRPKNVTFGTKVASSTRMTCTLSFSGKKFLIEAKFAKNVKIWLKTPFFSLYLPEVSCAKLQ